MPLPATGIYRYVDGEGVSVFVSDLGEVPAEFRSSAELVDLSTLAPALEGKLRDGKRKVEEGLAESGKVLKSVKDFTARAHEATESIPQPSDIHMPSFGAGVAVAFAVSLVFALVKSSVKFIFKIVFFLLAIALVVGAYLGTLGRATGLSEGPITTPQDIVREAKNATDAMNARVRARGQKLEQIEENE